MSTTLSLKSDQVVKIGGLSGSKNLVVREISLCSVP